MRTPKMIVGLVALIVLSLSGCSVASSGTVFLPPGAELGDQAIDPPATLPAKMVVQPQAPEEFDYSICGPIEEVDPLAVEFMNRPSVTEDPGASPSINGVTLLSGKQMYVETSYPKILRYIVRMLGSDGNVYWFGSSGDLTETEIYQDINLDFSGYEPIFGATEETRANFVWGERHNDATSLLTTAGNVVRVLGVCFEPRNGEIPTEVRVLSPEATEALVVSANSMRSVEPRLGEVLNQQFRWNESLHLVDNGRYGALLQLRSATGSGTCLSDFTETGSVFEKIVNEGGISIHEYTIFANADCSEPGAHFVRVSDDGSETIVESGNIDTTPYVQVFQRIFGL